MMNYHAIDEANEFKALAIVLDIAISPLITANILLQFIIPFGLRCH